jgi:hypothetical protein
VPFPLFDVAADRASGLWEVPFAVMDTAVFVHGDAEHAGAAVNEALAGAREAGGACVLVWHNEPRGRHVLATLDGALTSARAGGATIGGLAGALAAWTVKEPT